MLEFALDPRVGFDLGRDRGSVAIGGVSATDLEARPVEV
jgi:hypothetical protein